MNGDAEDQANQTYTIQIPGMRDFFAKPIITKAAQKRLRDKGVPEDQIPALSSQEERDWLRARVIRMKSQSSPVPEKLRWIPDVITHIDDAQDIFITALTLGKILVPKLMTRWIPYVGWALLISDVMNIATGVLSIALTGPTGKGTARTIIRLMGGNKARRISTAAKWMQKTNWVSFLLQAGQASDTLSGYGLRLGPLMGSISDTVWGGIRKLQGKQVRFVGPPPQDPFQKAARFLMKSYKTTQYQYELSRDDKEYLLLAEALATRIFISEAPTGIMEDRAIELQDTEVPVSEPWYEPSREVLLEEGIDPSGDIRAFDRSGVVIPTYLQAVQKSQELQYDYEKWRAIDYQYEDAGGVYKMVQDQAGNEAWDYLTGTRNAVEDVWDPYNIALQRAIEYSIFPPPATYQWRIRRWLDLSMQQVAWGIGEVPTAEQMKEQAIIAMGGWQAFPDPAGYPQSYQFRKSPFAY